MRRYPFLYGAMVLALLLAAVAGLTSQAQGPEPPDLRAPQSALGTAFTYQGQLELNGEPVDDECEMAFRLYDDATAGSQVGPTLTHTVVISDGLFTQALDFGAGAFTGDARWLGIQVKCPGDPAFVDLGRQALTAAPYAHYALSAGVAATATQALTAPWSGLSGMPAGFADGIDNDTTYSAGTGLALADSEFSINPAYRLPQTCADGQAVVWDGSTWACTTVAGGDVTGVYAGAGLTGGGASGEITLTVAFSGTGTADTAAHSDHDHGGVYTLVGHTHPGSDITSPVATATLALSAAAAPWSGLTGIPAGFADGIDNDTTYAAGNQLELDGTTLNVLEGSGSGLDADLLDGLHAGAFATSAHDHDNRYWLLSGNSGTTPGSHFVGTTDGVSLTLAVSGTAALRLEPNATSPNLIGGYSGNWVTGGVYGATIGGGGASGYLNRVTDNMGTVGGGQNNQAGDNAGSTSDKAYATVGGGINNTASGLYATIAGGADSTASGHAAAVGGGVHNVASGDNSAVGGGNTNTANGGYAVVAGGHDNQATNDSSAVGGGAYNVASGMYSTVGGGYSNDTNGGYTVIPGGYDNTASSPYATVSGGRENIASGWAATVGGGVSNGASGHYATVVGGRSNTAAGDYSLAAGRRAQANHAGCFVWGDSTDTDFASTAANQFLVRAAGGVGINTNNPGTAALVVVGTNASNSDNTATFANTALDPTNSRNSHIHWGTTGDWYIRSTSVDGKVILQDGGGVVGIGTSTPQATLHVHGTIRVDTLGSAGSTSLCINGNNEIASCSSSLRYKTNVADLELGLATVEQLRPVTFNWRDNGEPDLGFVAEEVDTVAPLLTTRNSAGEIEGVRYDRMVAVLVNAVQEQQQEIVELEAQNAQLETRLLALEAASGSAPRSLGGWSTLGFLVACAGLGWLSHRSGLLERLRRGR